jgi:uncharacterized protein
MERWKAAPRFFMPVRLLNSAVFVWPRREEALSAARSWAAELSQRDSGVQGVYCIGSCGRGDYGVGSDLDVMVLINDAEVSLVDRHRRYEPLNIPIPADVLVYTLSEWRRLISSRPALFARLEREKIVLFERDDFRAF